MSRPNPSDVDVDAVRDLVEAALRQYAQTPDGAIGAGGVTALELARNVRGWTHTTRLRDFIAARSKAAV